MRAPTAMRLPRIPSRLSCENWSRLISSLCTWNGYQGLDLALAPPQVRGLVHLRQRRVQLHEPAARDGIAGVQVRDAGARRGPAHRRRHADLLAKHSSRDKRAMANATFVSFAGCFHGCALCMRSPYCLTRV